jgi:hypothetical protein
MIAQSKIFIPLPDGCVEYCALRRFADPFINESIKQGKEIQIVTVTAD